MASDYLEEAIIEKKFPQKGVIIQEGRLIEGQLLFE